MLLFLDHFQKLCIFMVVVEQVYTW